MFFSIKYTCECAGRNMRGAEKNENPYQGQIVTPYIFE